MPIYVTSDAHQTGGDARDFAACDPRFAERLKRFDAAAGEDRVIRLGDWYDRWLGRRGRVRGCESGAEHLWAGRRGDLRIEGNHDRGCGPASAILEIGGRDFFFMHGHQFDAANSGLRRVVGWLATKIAGLLMDLVGSPVLPSSETIAERLLRLIGHEPNDERFEKSADRYRKLFGADVIVCGHTHRGVVREHYANCGRWPQYLVIGDDGSMELRTWK